MCLGTDLWPHRKEVQALPIEREREKIPLVFFRQPHGDWWCAGAFTGDLQVCPIGLHKQGRGGDGLIVFLLFHPQTWIMEIPDSHQTCWLTLTVNVLSVSDDMSAVLPVVAAGQSGFISTHQQVYELFSAVSKSFPSIRTLLIWSNAFFISVRWRSVNSLCSR